MSDFRTYKRRGSVEARPYVEGETLPLYVSISEADKAHGSPMLGDMIARDPLTEHDQWLINANYFARNYETSPVTASTLESVKENET